jgi:hypothetical protein
MTPDRWQHVQELFMSASPLPHDEQVRYLDRACGADDDLRAEVASLLAAASGAAERIHGAIGHEVENVASASVVAQLSRRIGPYRLVEVLGRGGMGAVYRAERDDDQYRTQVAIKLLPWGLETPEAIVRFRHERQILATLEHPLIVRLLDGGSTEEGLPYLVMEYVKGRPIQDYCNSRNLTVTERLQLFREICAAVQYAHQKLIVHRDIKPQNIIVTDDGTPKLLDFGIAKLLDADLGVAGKGLTRTGVHSVTIEYASPEQLQGRSVSTATDIYSLGAVLYELLCGVRAHSSAGDHRQLVRAILDVEPPKPSSVAPLQRRRCLQGDLDHIILRALQKEPTRRYASVEQFSEDLRRHVEGLPVAARPDTRRYRAGKFLKRHWRVVTAGITMGAFLLTAAAVSVQQARRANQRFADVRRLANSLIFEVDESIRQLQGSTQARELIVTRALEYLDDLAREAGGDSLLLQELAAAYMRVGDIQGNSRAPNLGRPQDGLVSYGRAKQILDRLASGNDDNPQLRTLLATAHYGMGALYWADRQADTSRASILAAIRIVESLPDPAVVDQRLVLQGYLGLFSIATAQGDVSALAEAAAKYLEAATRWAEAGSSLEGQYWLGVGYEMRAMARALGADADGAFADATSAAGLFESLEAADPADARYRREAAMALEYVALFSAGRGDASLWMSNVGDWTTAASALRAAAQRLERMTASDSNDTRAALQLATVLTSLAMITARHNATEAIPLFDQARHIYDGLAPEVRRSGYARELEWFTHCSMAEPLARTGRRAAAIAAANAGLAMVEPPAGKSLDTPQQLYFAGCRYLVAAMFRTMGRSDAQERLLDSVATDLRRMIRTNPGTIPPLIGLVETLQQLAELQPDQRCLLLEQAVMAWMAWPGPRTPFIQRRESGLQARAATCRSRE